MPTGFALNQAEVQAYFAQQIESHSYQPWIDSIARTVQTNNPVGVHGFLSSVGMPTTREQTGGNLDVDRLDAYTISITNQRYRLAIGLNSDDVRWDQTGDWTRKVGSIATRFVENDWKQLVDLLIAGDTDTGYDGNEFFGTHTFENSGSQINELTASEVSALDVATATLPTPEEFVDALVGIAGYMMGYVDGKGQPINQFARRFRVLVPSGMFGPAITAVRANNLDSGETNVIPAIRADGFEFIPIAEPRLTDNDEIYVLREDGTDKPLILQDDLSPYVDLLGQGSEYETMSDEVLAIGKAVRGFGYGEPLYAANATFS